jgi:two-component system response regulator GlrR
MEGMDGLELLDAIHRRRAGTPVVLLTAHGTIPDAVHAVQNGAFGFLTKPVDKDELLALLERAVTATGGNRSDAGWRSGIITRNARMEELLADAKMIAESDAALLITGESGTGKEMLARAVHAASPRAAAGFVALNCGAIPENLLESELFGHEKGAFTGATRDHAGLIAAADGGTLFLDEIGDMPPPLQVKLLRVLQEGTLRRVGGTRDIRVDVRVISATHRDLAESMRAGTFREDLYYRLNVVNLHLPALGERRDDIPLLANHFLERLAQRRETEPKSLAPEALAMLATANWPGNIRQLANVIERTAALTPGRVISAVQVEKALARQPGGIPSYNEARDSFSRRYLSRLLEATGGNVSQAARIAQRNRTDFYKLLDRHGVDPARFK